MFKIIIALMVLTLAACSDKSSKSSKGDSAKAENELVQTLAAAESSDFGFIVDVNLRTCLDESGMTVESVHTLVCAGKGVRTLDGIEELPALKNLNVSHNTVVDITPLAEVKGLQVLYATNNQIESVEALGSMTELNAISLRSNKLSNADAFYSLPQLEKLYVQGNDELFLDSSKLPSNIIMAI